MSQNIKKQKLNWKKYSFDFFNNIILLSILYSLKLHYAMHVRSCLFAFWLFFPLYQLSEFFKNFLMKFNNITFSKFVLGS